jgi:hypothetical protein
LSELVRLPPHQHYHQCKACNAKFTAAFEPIGLFGSRVKPGQRIGADVFPGRVVDTQVCPKLATESGSQAARRWTKRFPRDIAEQERGDRPLRMRLGPFGPSFAAVFNRRNNHRKYWQAWSIMITTNVSNSDEI